MTQPEASSKSRGLVFSSPVMTDPFASAWEPSAKDFMVATNTFEPEDGKKRYTARIAHWSAEDRKAHAEMGFHAGWGKAADQLEALTTRM